MDIALYGYFNKLTELLEQTIETANKLVEEFIGNYPKMSDTCSLNIPPKEGNVGIQGFTATSRDCVSERNTIYANTTTNNSTFIQNVSLGISTPPSASSGNTTPMKSSQ